MMKGGGHGQTNQLHDINWGDCYTRVCICGYVCMIYVCICVCVCNGSKNDKLGQDPYCVCVWVFIDFHVRICGTKQT